MNPLGRLTVRAVDVVNRRGKALGVRLVRWTGKRPYPIHPKHLVDHPWHDWYLPYLFSSDRVLGPVMPVVLDTPWAGAIDALGGLSLGLYDRLSRWKRDAAVRRPEERTGFRVVARKRRA